MNLQYVVSALLNTHHRLTLALDLRTEEVPNILQQECPNLIHETIQINAFDSKGRFRGGSELTAISQLLNITNADTVLINMMDTFISSLLRKAAIGINPPVELHGHLGGHYSRPKWFSPKFSGINSWLKQTGFARLSREGWFSSLLVPNEYDTEDLQQTFPKTQFVFMPEPGQKPDVAREDSRCHFNLPDDAIVLLNYGVGHRRKGLHLVTEAMRRVDSPRLFLFSAGRHTKNQSARDEARELEKRGRAFVLDRYITEEEEAMCFRGCDFVLTPYLSHYGSSNVLALAARAGRPVLSSDFDLIGRRVRERHLGILFRDQSVDDLESKLRELSERSGDPVAPFAGNLAAYAEELTVEAFHASVQTAFPNPLS